MPCMEGKEQAVRGPAHAPQETGQGELQYLLIHAKRSSTTWRHGQKQDAPRMTACCHDKHYISRALLACPGT